MILCLLDDNLKNAVVNRRAIFTSSLCLADFSRLCGGSPDVHVGAGMVSYALVSSRGERNIHIRDFVTFSIDN